MGTFCVKQHYNLDLIGCLIKSHHPIWSNWNNKHLTKFQKYFFLSNNFPKLSEEKRAVLMNVYTKKRMENVGLDKWKTKRKKEIYSTNKTLQQRNEKKGIQPHNLKVQNKQLISECVEKPEKFV